MSIAVPLGELEAMLSKFPWAYLVTVSDQGRAHVLAVPTELVDGHLRATVGRATRANATARPEITMVFPPCANDDHSLIVDGVATVADDLVWLNPTTAMLHRPAIG